MEAKYQVTGNEYISMPTIREKDGTIEGIFCLYIQNDITKHYRDIMDRLNAAIEWAAESGTEIVYIGYTVPGSYTGCRTNACIDGTG